MNTKKQTWVTIEEANIYFSKTEREFRWNKELEKDKQRLLDKALHLILESDLFIFPDKPKQDMKEAQCEQALYFLVRPEREREAIGDALNPQAKEKLKRYKNPNLVKKKIKTTDWKDDKDRDRLTEGRFNFGEYELGLSLVYIDAIRGAQNKLYEIEAIDKIKTHLRKIQEIWKNRSGKYPSCKALKQFWPGEIKTINTETDELIYKNTDQIIEALSSPEYSVSKQFYLMGRGFYIKPQNLIVLTWARAFKKGKKIYWKVILETLNSIYRKTKRTNLGDVFDEIDKERVFEHQETIRQIYIKYADPNYYENKTKYKARMDLIDSIYKKSFVKKISPFYKTS